MALALRGGEVGQVMSRGAVLLVCVCLISIPVVAPRASAEPTETIELLPTKMPWTLDSGTAVSTGTVIYMIGGFRNSSFSDRITRFDPSTGVWTDEAARLPEPVVRVSAVWTGTEILIFGGQVESSAARDYTIRFNPATGGLSYGANLTTPRGYAPTVWTGTYAYIFGGSVGVSDGRSDVLRYDPQADRMTVVATATLPLYTRDLAGTWDGTQAVLFGPAAVWDVKTFDPRTETFANRNWTGYNGVTMATAVQIGAYAYVFGGWGVGGMSSKITRFLTDSTAAVQLPVNLSYGFGLTASAVVGNTAYIFEGWTAYSDQNRIEKFTAVGTEHPSPPSVFPVLWIAIIAAAAGAGAIVAVVFLVRRKRLRGTPPATPPTAPPTMPPTGNRGG